MGRKARKVGRTSCLRHRILVIGPALEQKGGMASVQKLILKEMSDTFEVKHLSTHDEGSTGHRVRIFWMALIALTGKLLRNQVDLAHLHVSEKGSVLRKILIMLVLKAFGKPVVMHTHGCEFHTFHEGLPGWMRSLVNASLQQADCFVTLSESWRTYYITQCELDSSRVVTLPNPVEIPATVPDRTGSLPAVNFVFMGRIGQRKGAFDLIRAFAALPNRAKANLWLAGDGELAAAAALIATLELGDTVRLLGWIDEAERAEILAAAHVFVLPSYNEALPMALLEAMAMALPVISTSVGGIAEFVTDGTEGYLVSPGDIPALSQAMEQLVESESDRQTMGERARDRIRPLNLKYYAQHLADVYTALLEGTEIIEEMGIEQTAVEGAWLDHSPTDLTSISRMRQPLAVSSGPSSEPI